MKTKDKTIKDVNDIAKMYEIDPKRPLTEKIALIKKYLYKFTDCGAGIAIFLWGIKLTSIVEGSDAEVERELKFPFKESEYWNALDSIEKDVSILWHDANEDWEGC